MTPEQFCYWLQGFSELTESTPSEAQWKSVKEHLSLVFIKVTPPVQAPSVMDFFKPTPQVQPAIQPTWVTDNTPLPAKLDWLNPKC